MCLPVPIQGQFAGEIGSFSMFDSWPDSVVNVPSDSDASENRGDVFDRLLREAVRVPSLAIPMSERVMLLGGRFEVLRPLGHGGMGVVYEALDHNSGGRLALKTLSNLGASNIQRLKQEFRSLSDVIHPNLVGLHELFCDGQHWFFTMDLIEGREFPGVAGGGGDVGTPLAWQHPGFRDALAQLVTGVQAIHGAGKLHRDLKPSNVLITDRGRVVILDFGLVSDMLDEPCGEGERAKWRPVVGTPAYMAPEQAARAPATAASDWYAVGVMIYQALVGRLPFEGTRDTVLSAKQTRPVPRLSRDARLPGDLVALCEALLQSRPHDRPSGAEVLRAVGLGVSEAGSVTSTPPDRASQRAPTELFVGRRTELARLRTAFETVIGTLPTESGTRGRTTVRGPKVVLVHGSSGIGKSALVERFVSELASPDPCRSNGSRRRVLVLKARCYEREALPFKAFDGIVDELVAHLRELPDEQVAPLMPADVQALARVFPVLGRVPLVRRELRAEGGVEVGVDDPHGLRARAFSALRGLLANLADRAGVVLIIDDLQWSDLDSARMLEALVAPPGAPALLVIGIYRREDAHASHFLRRVLHCATTDERYRWRVASMFALHQGMLLSKDDASRSQSYGPGHVDPDAERATLGALVPVVDMPVDRLDAGEGALLARQLLGDVFPASDALVGEISREAEGNPFYIQELARYLCSREASNSCGGALAAPHLVSLAEAFASRLRALPETSRRLLQVIAVAGRPIRRDLALRAAELPHEDRRAFDLLRALHLVRTRGPAPWDEAEVYHDQVRVQVGATMEPHARRRRHARLARVLEASGDVHADWLAEQFEGAGLSDDAARYAVAAASESRGALAFSSASHLYRWAGSLVRAQYDGIVRRGTLTGMAVGLVLALLLAVFGVLPEAPSLGPQHALSLLAAFAVAGTVIGMVAGSVVTLLAVKDPGVRTPRRELAERTSRTQHKRDGP